MTITLLARDNKARGDLFTNLVSALFQSMGYTIVGLNTPRPGREIDIIADHCFGGPPMIAECKAHSKPIGGDDVNKFLGVLARERTRRNDTSIKGVVLSLSGFTGTADVQEADAPSDLTLVRPMDAIRQLMDANIVCADDEVGFAAGQLLTEKGLQLKLLDRELLVHPTGLLWIQYLGDEGKATHAALIHADGQPASEFVVEDVKATYPVRGRLSKLELLHRGRSQQQRRLLEQQACELYKSYLLRECGEFEMTGLSADPTLTTRRYPLERIYVPLKLIRSRAAATSGEAEASVPHPPSEGSHLAGEQESARTSVGEAISDWHQAIVLGDPGSGKSTLLKRVTVAYADPRRRTSAGDDLPDRDFLPIFVRCRQLRGVTAHSLDDILQLVTSLAELDDNRDIMMALFKQALRDGRALLLVDGLDEIPQPEDRLAFCRQLETFSARYPACPFLVTSRSVGYREMGFHLGHTFVHAHVADLEPEDIRTYVQAWYREIEGSSKSAADKASQVNNEILSTPRILRLAQNPLILATLILVRHWLGELPKKRSALYGEAVQVLLVNWNREAHEPIDPDEALPQLDFIAFHMMKNGYQQINKNELLDLLRAARQQMEDVLQHAKYTPTQFLEAVEYRSSLLTETGRRVVDGQLVSIYEFHHLAFQEYLAARAAVFGHYSDYLPGSSPLNVLKPYVGQPAWQEVFPLAAVLAGRAASDFMDYLLTLIREEFSAPARMAPQPGVSLFALAMLCLADDPSVRPSIVDGFFELIPATLRSRAIARSLYQESAFRRLGDSVYGPQLLNTLMDTYMRFHPARPAVHAGSPLAELLARNLTILSPDELDEWKSSLRLPRSSAGSRELVSKLLAIMELAFANSSSAPTKGLILARPFTPQDWQNAADSAGEALADRSPPVRHSAAWALVWLFLHTGVTCPSNTASVLLRLALLRSSFVARPASWALAAALQRQRLPQDRSWVFPPSSGHLDILMDRLAAAKTGRAPSIQQQDAEIVNGVLALCSLWGRAAARQDLIGALRAYTATEQQYSLNVTQVIETMTAPESL